MKSLFLRGARRVDIGGWVRARGRAALATLQDRLCMRALTVSSLRRGRACAEFLRTLNMLKDWIAFGRMGLEVQKLGVLTAAS